MRISFQKKLAGFMSALLLFCGILQPALSAQAASSAADGDGYATTYSLSELTCAAVWGATVSENGSDTVIAFPAQYNQVFYDIPATVKDAGLTKAVVSKRKRCIQSFTQAYNSRVRR